MRLPRGGAKPGNSAVITASAGQPKEFCWTVSTLTPTIGRVLFRLCRSGASQVEGDHRRSPGRFSFEVERVVE
jgi:hypothetical protein